MVTEAEVHHACDVIDGRGEEPKYEAIRAELGNRGSWSTIKKYRASWLAKEQQVPPVPENLHAQMMAVATAVWRSAYPLASASFGEMRRAAADEIAELSAALAQLESELAERDAATQRAIIDAVQLRENLAAVEAAHRAEIERRAELSGEVAALVAVNAELQTALLNRPSERGPALRLLDGAAPRAERAF